jgi:hypothetical protein
MEMARREGWLSNPKYNSMPEHMLKYRASAFLIRHYNPSSYLGIQTFEEIESDKDLEKSNATQEILEAQTQPRVAVQDFKQALEAARVEPETDVTSHHDEPPAAPPKQRRTRAKAQPVAEQPPAPTKTEPNPIANVAVDRGGEIDF